MDQESEYRLGKIQSRMNFEQFASLHGVILGRLEPGKWQRFPTSDKPRSRNGAVKYMGHYGLIQNWATMTEPAVWRADGESTEAHKRIAFIANQAHREAIEAARKAAQKAEFMLSECELSTHPYIASKGFPDEMVNVWRKEAENIAVIPMRHAGRIVGAQCISPDGDKKFLYGQRSSGSEFTIGNRGIHVLCEGYATGLSVRKALHSIKAQAQIHVTFSAGNMKKIAAALPSGYVIADNDASGTGEKVASEIGFTYWMSDTVGEDFNDTHQRAGLFHVAMQLKKMMMKRNE